MDLPRKNYRRLFPMFSKKSTAEVKFAQHKVQVIPWNYNFSLDDKVLFSRFNWMDLRYGKVLFRGSHQIREYLEITLPFNEMLCRYCLEVLLTGLFDEYDLNIIGYDEESGEYDSTYLENQEFIYSLIMQLEEEDYSRI